MNWFHVVSVYSAVVSSAFFGLVCGNVFTSVMKMKKVPQIESELIWLLESYLDTAENTRNIEQLREFLQSAKAENEQILDDPTYVENPINSYRMLRRMVEGWGEITKNLTCAECEGTTVASDFAQGVNRIKEQTGLWPEPIDLYGATIALIRLVNTYKLPMDELAEGRVYDTQTTPLTAYEFFLIGEKASERELMYEAVLWYNTSVNLLYKDPDGDKTLLARTAKKLSSALYQFGLPAKALECTVEALKYYPTNPGLIRDEKFYTARVQKMAQKEASKKFKRPPHPSLPYYFKYEALCRHQIKSPGQLSKLYCNLRNTAIPIIWTKVEYAHLDPPVVLFHDVISEKEIEWIKTTAIQLLSRSVLGNLDGKGDEYSESRISESAWLADNYAMAARLSRRITLITGLDASVRHWDTYAEPFQVLNYGLGGMYEPHHDFTKIYRDIGYENTLLFKNSGDRVATWMFYLTDVHAGGATVFPNLRARVPAVKGGAAFWYNIKRSGELDERHLHAGCPILLGSKWAANKWFRELGQAFRYGCTLDVNE